MEDYCAICGDSMDDKYVHGLPCSHKYHYECIQKSFMYNRKKTNECPLCRNPSGLLPPVNGLPRFIKGVHYNNLTDLQGELSNYKCTPCEAILKSGKRKGLECGSKCMLGFTICKRHHTSQCLKEKKEKEKEKKVGLGDALEQVQVDQLLEITA